MSPLHILIYIIYALPKYKLDLRRVTPEDKNRNNSFRFMKARYM